MPLSATAIRNAKASEKTRKLFDGGGLYLEVSPTGSKWWRLKYRFGGKEKRLAIGVYPEVSLKDARERREEARRLLAAEVDPSEVRRARKISTADRAENSFEVVAREWYAKHSASWVASHGDRIISSPQPPRCSRPRSRNLPIRSYPWSARAARRDLKRASVTMESTLAACAPPMTAVRAVGQEKENTGFSDFEHMA